MYISQKQSSPLKLSDNQKSKLKPWLKERWCIGTFTGEYVANVEDVLDVYQQPAEAGVVR